MSEGGCEGLDLKLYKERIVPVILASTLQMAAINQATEINGSVFNDHFDGDNVDGLSSFQSPSDLALVKAQLAAKHDPASTLVEYINDTDTNHLEGQWIPYRSPNDGDWMDLEERNSWFAEIEFKGETMERELTRIRSEISIGKIEMATAEEKIKRLKRENEGNEKEIGKLRREMEVGWTELHERHSGEAGCPQPTTTPRQNAKSTADGIRSCFMDFIEVVFQI